MARRVSWTNNSTGHTGTYVYRAETLDPQDPPAPVATVDPVAQGETAEWIDNDELEPGDYDYAVQDFDGQGVGDLSAVDVYTVLEDYSAAQIGDEIGGGIYTGIDTIGGNDYHIVSGKAVSEEYGLAWKTARTATAGTRSDEDGLANTDAMVAAGIANHPAAQHCVNYTGGGHSDWHMPALNQVTLMHANLSGHPEFADNVASGNYTWTSTEHSDQYDDYAKTVNFDDGGFVSFTAKTSTVNRTRPIRRVPV